jgi:hypothetical protein
MSCRVSRDDPMMSRKMSRDHESFDRLRTGLRPIVCGAGGRVEQRGRGARVRGSRGAGVQG